jgi:hypothetical protein
VTPLARFVIATALSACAPMGADANAQRQKAPASRRPPGGAGVPVDILGVPEDDRSRETEAPRPTAAAPVRWRGPGLFGSPHRADGSCPRATVAVPSLAPLCYRACRADADCPSGATCGAFANGKLCMTP